PPCLDLFSPADRDLQGGDLPGLPGDFVGERRLLGRERPPVRAEADDGQHVEDAEEQPQVEAGQRQRDTDAAPAPARGWEVDPDRQPLPPGRRSARPTATANEGAELATSSASA